ncbi:unnamed protein product [Ostreobium quekettii]|uniref:Uncharacterized protein n=1 Tax=Ostreobium quekettii TaxID=121088 RepID=A0A8S1IPD4_9CHLO|nr:unnamed protein product [Ostreobium quekettii]
MMKMHGLGDGAYWIVSYTYYLILYTAYIAVFVGLGSLANLPIFRLNDYGVQIAFYFLYGNLQIAFAFLMSGVFGSTLTAMVFSFLWIFGGGLVSLFLMNRLIMDDAVYVKLVQLVPAFSAYRGWFEMGVYSLRAKERSIDGLTWESLNDDKNDMDFLLVAFVVEWPLFMMVAWYVEQVYSTGTGFNRHPFYFLQGLRKAKNTREKQVRRWTKCSNIM